MKVFYRKHCSLLDWLQLIPEQLKKITNRVIVCRNLEEEITRGVVLLSSFNLFKSPIANKGCLTSSYFCAAVHFFFSIHHHSFLLIPPLFQFNFSISDRPSPPETWTNPFISLIVPPQLSFLLLPSRIPVPIDPLPVLLTTPFEFKSGKILLKPAGQKAAG